MKTSSRQQNGQWENTIQEEREEHVQIKKLKERHGATYTPNTNLE